MDERPQIDWDVPSRVTHWVVALCVVLNLFFLEDDPHDYAGYVAAAFVAFRFAWGFFASIPPRHNVLAKLVYVGVWTAIIALAVTGWMLGLDRFWAEEWLQNLHADVSTALEVLIVTHLLGVAIDSIRHRRKTWAAMLTGRR